RRLAVDDRAPILARHVPQLERPAFVLQHPEGDVFAVRGEPDEQLPVGGVRDRTGRLAAGQGEQANSALLADECERPAVGADPGPARSEGGRAVAEVDGSLSAGGSIGKLECPAAADQPRPVRAEAVPLPQTAAELLWAEHLLPRRVGADDRPGIRVHDPLLVPGPVIDPHHDADAIGGEGDVGDLFVLAAEHAGVEEAAGVGFPHEEGDIGEAHERLFGGVEPFAVGRGAEQCGVAGVAELRAPDAGDESGVGHRQPERDECDDRGRGKHRGTPGRANEQRPSYPARAGQCSIQNQSGGAASYFEYVSSSSTGTYSTPAALSSMVNTPTTPPPPPYSRDPPPPAPPPAPAPPPTCPPSARPHPT